MITKLFAQFMKRKLVAGIVLLLIAGGGYYGYTKYYGTATTMRYVSVAAEKGTLVVSIS